MISGDLSLKVRKDWLFTMSLQSRGTVTRDDKGVNTYCFARVFLFQYKDRIYQLLREARLYNPSLPNFDR